MKTLILLFLFSACTFKTYHVTSDRGPASVKAKKSTYVLWQLAPIKNKWFLADYKVSLGYCKKIQFRTATKFTHFSEFKKLALSNYKTKVTVLRSTDYTFAWMDNKNKFLNFHVDKRACEAFNSLNSILLEDIQKKEKAKAQEQQI